MPDLAPANPTQPDPRPTRPDPRPTHARPTPDPPRPAPDPARPAHDPARPVLDPGKTKARTVPAQDRTGLSLDCYLLIVYLLEPCWILDLAYGI